MIRMQRTLPDFHFAGAIHCAVLLMFSVVASADGYRDARAELVTAYEAQDYPAMRAAALKSLDARPAYPGGLFNLALAEVLGGDAEASLHALNELLAKKIDFGADEADEFAPLHDLPGWDAYATAVTDLYHPIGDATVAYRHWQRDFIPEGIAAGTGGELYLGSIRHGEIVRIGETLARASDGPHWSVFGMRLAADGRLWFVSSAISEFAALDPADEGKTGLFAIDTNSGEIVVRALLHSTGNKQVLGDLILVDADTIFLADQTDGIVYRYTISGGEFATVVERGHFGSPQGLVLDESGAYLYVADYIGGLYRLELATGEIGRVTPIDSASDYGIDGLYRYGNKLVAIQNGIRPNRVVQFELSADGSAVIASRVLAMNLPEFDEPNLGVMRGDEFLFIANSHWNRFEQDGGLPDDLSGPVVLSIDLRSD